MAREQRCHGCRVVRVMHSRNLCETCYRKAARPCRHCKAVRRVKGRGLCFRCYTTPSILKKYRAANRGRAGQSPVAVHVVDPLPAPGPTQAVPGTEEKIRVLEARVAAGQELHHPNDARLPTGGCSGHVPRTVPVKLWLDLTGSQTQEGNDR